MDDDESDSSVTRFVTHHLEELDATYWKNHAGTPRPSPQAVLDLLELQSHRGDDDDGIDTFDLTLPGDVTNYVVSVRFDERGTVRSVDMER